MQSESKASVPGGEVELPPYEFNEDHDEDHRGLPDLYDDEKLEQRERQLLDALRSLSEARKEIERLKKNEVAHCADCGSMVPSFAQAGCANAYHDTDDIPELIFYKNPDGKGYVALWKFTEQRQRAESAESERDLLRQRIELQDKMLSLISDELREDIHTEAFAILTPQEKKS
jgi:hypothetical protein